MWSGFTGRIKELSRERAEREMAMGKDVVDFVRHSVGGAQGTVSIPQTCVTSGIDVITCLVPNVVKHDPI